MKYFKYKELDEATPEDVDLKSFAPKDELNKDIWENNKLKPEIRKDLLSISRDFLEDLEIEGISVEDIIFTGSLANYNWSKEHSDVDLHIVIDFSTIGDDRELIKKYFDAVRKNWNKTHEDITVNGFPVELYVQDTIEKHTSSGVYSILKNKWNVEPDKDKISTDGLDKDDIKEKSAELMTEIEDLEKRFSDGNDAWNVYSDASDLFDRIKSIRKDNFDEGNPEMSEGNLIFKTLRRNGYMERLLELRTKSYDKARSVK